MSRRKGRPATTRERVTRPGGRGGGLFGGFTAWQVLSGLALVVTLLALLWFTPILSFIYSGVRDSLFRIFGSGLVLVVVGMGAISWVAWRRHLGTALPLWNEWLGAGLLFLAGFGVLSFFDAGGDLGDLVSGGQDFSGVLRLAALTLAGTVFIIPRQALDLLSDSGSWLLRLVQGRGTSRRQRAGRPPVDMAEPLPPESTDIAEVEAPEAPVQGPEPAQAAVEPISTIGRRLPPVDLLDRAPEIELMPVNIEERAKLIEEALASYGVDAKVVQINPGPVVTQFGVEPGWDRKFRRVTEKDQYGRTKLDQDGNPKQRLVETSKTRVKVERITSLGNDLALALAAPTVRIEAPVPGKSVVGIEVPNTTTGLVGVRGVIESTAFQKLKAKSKLALALGKGAGGEAVVADLAKMPHLLIAGATGSGKTICIDCVIACLLMHNTPDEVRFLLIDPKRVELVAFNTIPHLVSPVVITGEDAVAALRRVNREMDNRYKKLAAASARDIDSYNKRAAVEEPLPYLVVIIDELADLMMASADIVEPLICRLAQLARATGIHLVIATQRPSVDVVTGLIKANFPCRISFAVTSQVDSRTILDVGGAEKLLGRGDMLYLPPDAVKPKRLQGSFISDREIERLVGFWATKHWQAVGGQRFADNIARAFASLDKEESLAQDPLLEEARQLAARHGRISTSFLQRRLHIGYPRAARLVDLLQEEGVVRPGEPGKAREASTRGVQEEKEESS